MSRDDINDAEVESGQSVSGQTKNIIFYITSAICTDPNPGWIENSFDLEEIKEGIIDNLPEYFREMAVSGREITTFDFLNWLCRNLEKIYPN